MSSGNGIFWLVAFVLISGAVAAVRVDAPRKSRMLAVVS